MPLVEIPYKPRSFQNVVHQARQTHRFAVIVCHRRFGKTVLGVNELIKSALTVTKPRPRSGYIGPTYTQSKAVCWDYVQHYSRPIPGVQFNQSELRTDYPNEGQVRLYGADNPDSLRGLYFDDAVLDEYGMHPPKTFTEVIGPTLVDRGGSALFMGTPNGKNQFYDIVQEAKSRMAAGDPHWWFAEFKASQTGLLDPAYLQQAKSIMTADEYEQEFECSFEASVKGAIYVSELRDALNDKRITRVPLDPLLPVDTYWDLGVGDATAIWFAQSLRSGEVRLIDYYENSGEGLPFYVQVLRERGYTYGRHTAPHDIQVKEFSSGRSRLETAQTLGIRFNIAPNIPLEDGIHAARMLFPRCYFDEVKTQSGREALMHYRSDYNTRINEFKAVPVHDWSEHGASAFRYLAVSQQTPRVKTQRQMNQPQTSKDAWMA